MYTRFQQDFWQSVSALNGFGAAYLLIRRYANVQVNDLEPPWNVDGRYVNGSCNFHLRDATDSVYLRQITAFCRVLLALFLIHYLGHLDFSVT